MIWLVWCLLTCILVDALQPTFYQKCAEAQGAIDAVVCSPWFTVLDVALAVAAARSVVCMHVPGHYVASGLAPRYTYLQELQQQGRLAVLFGLPRGPMGWRCASCTSIMHIHP